MEIEWSGSALDDVAGLEKESARRIRQAVERFAATGAGDVRRLQGIEPAEFRLRAGDYRIRFRLSGRTIQILRVLNRREAYR